MKVCEIFSSIQGESTRAGMPCTFVRLSGCNLRCTYCDTKYAYHEGAELSAAQIFKKVEEAAFRLVEITGGEPLLQRNEMVGLTTQLLDADYCVLIETNGTLPIGVIDRRAVVIMDVKTPASGMSEMTDFTNFDCLKKTDEVKFVICNREDYLWAGRVTREHGLSKRCAVLFSPAFGALEPRSLADWILADRLDVRLNLQLHKYIYDPHERMV